MRLEEQQYLDQHPSLKRLTFDGINDLYCHPLYGARTLTDCIRMEQIAIDFRNKPSVLYPKEIECSYELCQRNEDHIQKHGFSIF